MIDDATQPWRQPPLEIAEAWLASAESWMLAKEGEPAMASLRKAEALKPEHQHVGLIAIDLMGIHPQAEDIVRRQLARPDAPPLVRIAYGRKLAAMQRYSEATPLLQAAIDGHGVALARSAMAQDDVTAGRLVRLFPDVAFPSPLAYFIVYRPDSAALPRLVAFRDWLRGEAHAR